MLYTKKSHQSTIFHTFECSNESSPNYSCPFWNQKYRVFKSYFTVQCHERIPHLYFLAQTIYTLNKKSPSKWNFQTFVWLGENSWNFLCHIWNQSQTLLYFIPFRQKFQTFDWSLEISSNLYFDRLLL